MWAGNCVVHSGALRQKTTTVWPGCHTLNFTVQVHHPGACFRCTLIRLLPGRVEQPPGRVRPFQAR
ncbi:hypothetical protein AB28_1271 [Raoultella ornithinolytica 2-156-04_S1_C2]|nr:hypothetical protein AB00_1258 [Raoultella ornithinolytica 2-156-04_S1_C1]KDX15174.1 hypothetical protein AB28_1271 [Raoultella ornithinolytica 2-156-04_S1_C2]